MASNATISVYDGQLIPVAHEYEPVAVRDGSVAEYQNKAAPSFAARETLQLKYKRSAKVRTTFVDVRIPRTVTETINGVSVARVADFATIRLEIIVPLEWPTDLARDARVIGSNLAAHPTVAKIVEDGEFVW